MFDKKKYYHDHIEYYRDYATKRAKWRKEVVLTHYGNGELKCVRCGFDDIRALSVDHINGGGSAQRKGFTGGRSIYYWIIKNKFPKGFQTLCMNCQFIKRFLKKPVDNSEQK